MTFGGGWNEVARHSWWNVAGWFVWVAMFIVLEITAARAPSKRLTFTMFAVDLVPRWAIAAFIGWMAYHFLIAHQ